MHPPARRRTTVSRLLRAISIFLLVVFIAVASFGVSQYMVWRDARQLAHDLESEKQQNLDAAWQQYAKLASKSHLPFILWSAESAMRNALMSNADRTILKYEEPDGSAVMETEWVHAHDEVAHALQLDPNDKTIHGKLRLIDGHLARIRGNARHDTRLMEEARQDFEDAANYMKKSPDPWLGLARLYIYSLHDMEHAEAAIREAERRGHDIGKRETAQFADGYRYQGERAMISGRSGDLQADAQRYYDMAARPGTCAPAVREHPAVARRSCEPEESGRVAVAYRRPQIGNEGTLMAVTRSTLSDRARNPEGRRLRHGVRQSSSSACS